MKTFCMNYFDSIMFFICFQNPAVWTKNPFMVAEQGSELRSERKNKDEFSVDYPCFRGVARPVGRRTYAAGDDS